MSVCLCCFQPPPAKAPLSVGHLLLLFEQVNLGSQGLDLFIHHLVMIDLGHKTPIVTGELVKCVADGAHVAYVVIEVGTNPHAK